MAAGKGSVVWFRYYIEALDDPKVQQLSAEQFRMWVNLLCIAAKNGGKMPSDSDCAFALRVTPDTFRVTFAALHDAKLFDKDVGRDKHTEPHNWKKRQGGSNRPSPWAWSQIRTAIFMRDDYTCTYCGERGGKLECDHIKPVSLGGSHKPANLTTACFKCNRSKAGKQLSEWTH